MGENAHPLYTPLHRKVTSFNNKEFEVIYRHYTVDYDMYTSVMMEDAYRLKDFPLKPGMTAIDLGAHVGTVSLMLASMGLKVYAVEILPENIEVFKWNVAKNGYGNLIKIYQRAIASTSNTPVKAYYTDPTESPFHKVQHFTGWTLGKPGYKVGKTIDVNTITLEDLFKENNIEHCHILKFDIEGAEWDAFKDVPEHILNRIDLILGEIHFKVQSESVDNSSVLPLLKGLFVNASMIYQELDSSPYRAPCFVSGECSNCVYIRKGLPIPLKW